MNPLLTSQFWDSSRSKKKTKGEKTPPYIFVDGKSESDVLSLVSKTTGDSSVNKSGALLEDFDPLPFFSVKNSNLLEINTQKNAEIRYIGPATIDDAKYNDSVFYSFKTLEDIHKKEVLRHLC